LIATAIAASLLVIGGFAAWWFKPRSDPSAALVVGSRWIGAFIFRPPIVDYSGDVSLSITERHGPKFKGIYSTEGANYVWEGQGEVRGDRISWEFARLIREKNPTNVVHRAHVTGRISGERMRELIFDNPGDGTADMTLTREPGG
jgi:hypothetical protein